MARAPLTFRQRDVVAVIRAVERTGHHVRRVEISKEGNIAVVIGGAGTEPNAVDAAANEWDCLLAATK